jgi:hypothetical protein
MERPTQNPAVRTKLERVEPVGGGCRAERRVTVTVRGREQFLFFQMLAHSKQFLFFAY